MPACTYEGQHRRNPRGVVGLSSETTVLKSVLPAPHTPACGLLLKSLCGMQGPWPTSGRTPHCSLAWCRLPRKAWQDQSQ